MTLRLTTAVHRGATLLTLAGTADFGAVAAQRTALAAAAAGAALVVVDLDQVTFADADGLRDLVALLAGRDREERVHLVTRRNSVTTVLTRARIHHVVGVHRTVDEAIAAYGSRRRRLSRPV